MKTRLGQSNFQGLQRAQSNKAVLLFSGGVDSTAAGLVLTRQGYTVYPLLINYGQRSWEAEHQAAQALAQALRFEKLEVMDIQTVASFGRQLTSNNGQVKGDDDAWVPGRNTLFLVLGGIYGVHIDADGVALGYCLEDNGVFGDNDYHHHLSAQLTLTCSFERPFSVLMPIRSLTKRQLIAELVTADVFEQTVSCWNATVDNNQIAVCGECANCLERKQAFQGVI